MNAVLLLYNATISLLIGIGIMVILSTKSLIKMLIGAEIMFNGALLYLVLVGSLAPVQASTYSIFSIILASGELVLATSIVVLYYRLNKKVFAEKIEKEVDS